MGFRLEQRTIDGNANRLRRTQTTQSRADLPADALTRIVADIVERECGVAPRFARPGSFARRSYAASLLAIQRDARGFTAPSKRVVLPSHVRAATVIAAHRACWREMRDGDGQRARFRSEIRCILALTPGYAIWRGTATSELSGSGSVQWLGGRMAWRTQNLRPKIMSTKRAGMPRLADLDSGFGFEAVRRAVLGLVDGAGAPVKIEQIVMVLDRQFQRKGGHCQ